MEKKKKLSIPLLILLAAAFVVLISQTINIVKELQKKKEYNEKISAASLVAADYVRGKYGFEPELLDMTDDRLCDYYNSVFLDFAAVIKMRSNGRDFYVMTENYSDDPLCADDYQWSEIEAAILAEIDDLIPGGRLVELSAKGKWTGNFVGLDRSFSKYFDGDNLDEVMENSVGSIELVFPDVDFSGSGLDELLQGWGMDYCLTAFDTAERAEEFVKRENETVEFSA